MAEDWQPGDVAVCVDETGCRVSEHHKYWVRIGGRYTVIDFQFAERPPKGNNPHPNHNNLWLGLLEIKHPTNGWGLWGEFRFKKEPPLVKETETEREKELNDC